MNIVFMGTPDIAVPVLRELNKRYNVSLVVTQEDKKKGRGKKLLPPPVKVVAEELGIEVYQPHNINDEVSIKKLEQIKADLFVVIAYGQILKEDILNLPDLCINIHASLLPHLRGAAPINRAIINGDIESGVTIMKMAKGLDTGDMSIVKKINIEGMNAEELEDKMAELGSLAIVEFIENYKNNNIVFTPQDNEKATYAEKIDKSTGFIDFEMMSTKQIINLINGLYSSPGASCMYRDVRFKILRAEEVDIISEKKAGTIIDSKKKLYIKTKDGVISVKSLQFPGKKAMDIKAFLAGNSFEEGSLLK